MRLWTLHPAYLDAKGLVALWREGLLAQKVLSGQTRGYTRHPQLQRFQDQAEPLRWMGAYLLVIQHEATRRGYRFDVDKILAAPMEGTLSATRGQLEYEGFHLYNKLCQRDPATAARLPPVSALESHPLFQVVAGGIAPWEVLEARREH